ncbi:MAG: hypothetical protein ACI9Y7_000462 [Dokdonia sp.]|jgi:hypothetical protein
MINKRSVFVTAIAGLLIYLLFPRVAGYVYMSNTDPIEIEEKRKEYWKLTDYDRSNEFNPPDFYERRIELVLWMRVRYLHIDEGHFRLILLERWKILFEYWKL